MINVTKEYFPNILKLIQMREGLQLHKGEVGFGRGCVGIIDGASESYVDLIEYTKDYDVVKQCTSALMNSPVDAYHKHSCLAVLVRNDDYVEAYKQLEKWCEDILKEPTITFYEGKINDVNMWSGITAPCVHLADKLPKEMY